MPVIDLYKLLWFLSPFRLFTSPLLSICANDAASDGFSATMNTLFIFESDFIVNFFSTNWIEFFFVFWLWLRLSVCLSACLTDTQSRTITISFVQRHVVYITIARNTKLKNSHVNEKCHQMAGYVQWNYCFCIRAATSEFDASEINKNTN